MMMMMVIMRVIMKVVVVVVMGGRRQSIKEKRREREKRSSVTVCVVVDDESSSLLPEPLSAFSLLCFPCFLNLASNKKKKSCKKVCDSLCLHCHCQSLDKVAAEKQQQKSSKAKQQFFAHSFFLSATPTCHFRAFVPLRTDVF